MHYIPILFSFILSQLLQSLNAVTLISPTDLVRECHSDFTGATHSLYLFDNDGVLKPAEGSASVHEHGRARQLLTELAKEPKNEVWVISGRSLGNLQKQYSGIRGLNLAGQLGGEIQRYGLPVVDNYEDLAQPTRALTQKLLETARPEDLQPRKSGSIIFTHQGQRNSYTRNVLAKMQELAQSSPFGYANYEMFATLTHEKCHKGRLAAALLQNHIHPDYFVMSFGDAKIDEPMFHALTEHSNSYGRGKAVSVLVHSADDIRADHRLKDHHAVYDFFENLLSLN